MPTSVKDGGTWKTVKAIYYKQNGAWVPVQRGYVKVAGSWVESFASAVTATISATTTNLNLSSLFSTADWQSTTKKKIVVIAAGVIIGSSNPALAALVTGTGMGGLLDLIISGQVQGAGGAINSGVGGDAINNQLNAGQLTIQLNSGAAVRSGGGGGGRGGAGTATTYINRQPASGQSYYVDFGSGPSTYWINENTGNPGDRSIYWNSVNPIVTNVPLNATFFDFGGYRYYRGTAPDISIWYGLWREQISTGATTGGNGGRGQGYDGAAAAGSAGGTNAGTGGAGGAWGTAGATGAAGNNGAGIAGGAAGRAIFGAARTLVNNGTINGAVV